MLLLPSLAALILGTAAYRLPLQLRANSDGIDGPTTDGTAGIGAEFESPGFGFVSCTGCSDSSQNKGKTVNGRSDPSTSDPNAKIWALTADTGEDPKKLSAEYILNGRVIKVGSGAAASAGGAIAQDLTSWSTEDPPLANRLAVNIDDGVCNPGWLVSGIGSRTGIDGIPWSPQITTAMPLEAVYNLMQECVAEPKPEDQNVLDGYDFRYPPRDNLEVVTPLYFQTSPNGINQNTVTNDVLGFCSLVLSYAKSASTPLAPNESPKLRTSFMPRTQFNTLFKQVSDRNLGNLFDLFDRLACYKTNYLAGAQAEVVLDDRFCTGTVDNPTGNGVFAGLQYTSGGNTVGIQQWISGITTDDSVKDALTLFDANIDGSIGGLNTALETIYGGTRSVPLFEFRDLNDIKTSGIQQFMTNVDNSIQAFHAQYRNRP